MTCRVAASFNKVIQLAELVTTSMRIRLLGAINKPISEEKVQAILQKMKTMRSIYQDQFSQLNEMEINSALSRNQLIPYYQPKISSVDGKVKSLEVLARIKSPYQMDAITPAQFIPAAERLDLIENLTFNLINQALSELPRINQEFGPECHIAINISPTSLNNPQLPEVMMDILTRHNIFPNQLMLEITESVAVENPVQLETLGRLRIKGFELSLDDFGTGFTNIQQLKSLPFSEIKLDRSMVYGISTDHMSQVVTQSLMSIFEELDVSVVAEGIDNEKDLNYLNALPIPMLLQGYIISKPKALDDICRWHTSWKKIIESLFTDTK